MNLRTLVFTFFAVLLITLMSGCTTNNSGVDSGSSSWLENYSPVHFVGNGDDAFWINYPSGNPSSGQHVDHLNWVVDSLKKGCVIFVVHRTGCVGCQAQADRVINLAEKYQDQLEFHDIDIAEGGATEQKAYDAYVYDPDGPPGYIALTSIFTYVKHDGETKIGWHSWEGNVADSDMEDWIRDAIYYHHANNGGK